MLTASEASKPLQSATCQTTDRASTASEALKPLQSATCQTTDRASTASEEFKLMLKTGY
jgi:hypothetical protein